MLLSEIIKKNLYILLEEKEEDNLNQDSSNNQVIQKPTNIGSELTLFHWSADDNLTKEKVDPFRIGSSQNKRKYSSLSDLQKPAGLYTTLSPNSFYGRLIIPSAGPNQPPLPNVVNRKNLYVIKMKNIKFFDGRNIGSTTDRIPKGVLMDLKQDGYDVIVGRGMIGEPEFIILNKDKIEKIIKADEELKKELVKKYGGVRHKYNDEDIDKIRSQIQEQIIRRVLYQNLKEKKEKKFKKKRKYSKSYCDGTPCSEMGFTQKASCRPYKNCYK